MNESPDKNLEKAPIMKCRTCGGRGVIKTFDDKGRPDGEKSCGDYSGTGNAR